jgi:hypothetical protein
MAQTKQSIGMRSTSELNLDDLFGDPSPIQVRYGGRLHDMRRPVAMGPLDGLRFQRLQAQWLELQRMPNGEDDELQAERLETAIDGQLMLVCPTLAEMHPPFAVRVRALEHYLQQLAPPKQPELEPGAEAEAASSTNPKDR